jgi:ankyrin repeat protein
MVNTKLLIVLLFLSAHHIASMSLAEFMGLSEEDIRDNLHKKVLGGQTPLYTAVRKNSHESVIRRLVDLKADPDFSGGRSWTPLRHAVNNNKQKMVDLLIELKANVHEEGMRPDGTRVSSLLSDALPDDSVDIARSLISAGAEIGKNERLRVTFYGENQVGPQSGQAGAEIGVRVSSRAQAQVRVGQCPPILEEAIRRRALKIAKLLVASGAYAHAVSEDGSAIIDLAVEWGDAQLVQALIDKGARVDFQTVLNAAKTGNPKKVQIISRAYYAGQRREEIARRISQEEFENSAVEYGFVGAAWIAMAVFAWQFAQAASA